MATRKQSKADAGRSRLSIQKWGAVASFLLAVSFVVAPLIYLMGEWRTALGRVGYDLADLLSGPVLAAGLVTAVAALREHIGDRSPRKTNMALMTALVAAAFMLAVACIRAANRHYHFGHPELGLESSTTVLTVWTTLVAGMGATGWHVMGWTLVLLASAGWTSQRLPRALCVVYLLAAANAFLVYLMPMLEGNAAAFSAIAFAWQGVLLWKAQPSLRSGD